MSGYRYLFGPIASRRLGLSLGVDLVPVKTCTFDCRFCQVGLTSRHTLERREYVPLDAVLAEFEQWLAGGGTAERITLSGSGEPTLHSRFGDFLAAVKRRCSIPTALLTNGSLLGLADVRRDAARADLVKASLSAWDQASLDRINRPAAGLSFQGILDGLRAFAAEYAGRLWIEVFVLGGVNDTADGVRRIAALTAGLRPERVQLNTVDRPPAESDARPVPRATLNELARLFDPPAEVIGDVDPETARRATGGRRLGHRPSGAA